MKKLLLLLSLLPALVAAQTPYMKKEIWELAGTADLVVHGKVSQAQQGLPKITLSIVEVIAGEYSSASIDITKFINNKMGKRWAKYAEGEEVVLFLKKAEDKWELMGDAGEGEKLVMGKDIYLDGRGGSLWNKFTYHTLVPSGQIYAEKSDLAEFKLAVKTYRSCFEIYYLEETVKGFDTPQQVPHVKQLCDDAAMDVYRGLSYSADRMAELSLNTKID